MNEAQTTIPAEQTAVTADEQWSLREVAAFLKVKSTDHASRWLSKNNVPRYDVGTGSRKVIRVNRRDVEAAKTGCILIAPVIPEKRASHQPSYRGRYRGVA